MKGRGKLIKNTLQLIGQNNELFMYWLHTSLEDMCTWMDAGLVTEIQTRHYSKLSEYIREVYDGRNMSKEEALN